MMKKIFINISYILVLATSLSSCKKSLTDKYNNPELTSNASLATLFTGILNNDRVRPAYWNQRTYLMPHSAVYAQTASFDNVNTAYQQIDGYVGNYWSDFYYPAGNGSGPMAIYRTMEKAYAALSPADQASQAVFLQAAKIVMYDQASKMIDAWGDIPFTGAGSLETNSVIKDPKFDDAKTTYNTLISGLNDAATFFKSAALPANIAASFSKQDILLSGSTDRWRRYANSIRLRLLMRISFVDETSAKTAVTAMLANGTEYPLIDGGNNGIYNPATTDVLLQPLTNYTNTPRSALTEIDSFFAPDYMVNTVMAPANDPRLAVMFDKYGQTTGGTFVPNPTYKAMPIAFTNDQQTTQYTKYAIVDSATFVDNGKLPGIAITSSEVNFLKAEAFERWGSTGDAKNAYEIALQQSISFYYYLNSISSSPRAKTSAPSSDAITAFLKAANVAYTGSSDDKLANIWIQKWVNFGLLQSDEAWSEYRRTKYPKLTFVPQTLNPYQLPPTRLTYPSVETGFNTNYGAVAAKDTRTTKIFWDVK